MWGKRCIGFNILSQKDPNMHLIAGQSQPMEKRLQMAPDLDKIYILDKKSTNRIQSIVETMIYYARSVDPTMLQAINEISRVQSQPTRDTAGKAKILLDYSATYPNAILWYNISDMVLHVDSDV